MKGQIKNSVLVHNNYEQNIKKKYYTWSMWTSYMFRRYRSLLIFLVKRRVLINMTSQGSALVFE